MMTHHRHWHNFDAQTRVAIAVGTLLLAVILGKIGLYTYQEGTPNGSGRQAVNAVHRDLSGPDRGGQTQPGSGPACEGPMGATGKTVPHDDGGAGHVVRLFRAIRQVESGGNDRAVGDGGRSIGPYQCGLAAWLDGGGKAADYPHMAWNRAATEAVMLRYWQRYGAVTDEQKARIWNGGPNGMKKKATLPYWRKVSLALAVLK